jgi:hypothetical protein
MDRQADDIRGPLIEASEHLRAAESALSKARNALGVAMHAESFVQQRRALDQDQRDRR